MIDLRIEFSGVKQLMAQNAAFAKRLPGVVTNAMRRPLRHKATRVRQRIRRETGIGKSVWGFKGGQIGLERVVKVIRPRIKGDSLITGLRLTGLPAMIETGGQIKPHIIKRAWGRATVNHPGAAVRAHYIAKQEMANAGSEVVQAIAADLQKLKAKVFNSEYAAA